MILMISMKILNMKRHLQKEEVKIKINQKSSILKIILIILKKKNSKQRDKSKYLGKKKKKIKSKFMKKRILLIL